MYILEEYYNYGLATLSHFEVINLFLMTFYHVVFFSTTPQ